MTTAHDPRRERLYFGLWLALVLFQLVQVWFGSQFPSQDGPVHVYVASMLVEMSDVQRAWFVSNPHLEPNVSVHYLLAGLIALGADTVVAERLVLSLYVVLFALGTRRFVLALGKDPVFALLPLPFALGYFVHAGFYNFCLGSALAFWTLGHWLVAPIRTPVPRLVAISVLLLLLAFTHLFWLLFTLLAIGVLRSAWITSAPRGERLRAWLRDASALLLAALPTGFLIVSFAQRHAIEGTSATAKPPLVDLLVEFASARPLYALDRAQVYVVLPLLAALAALYGARLWCLLRGARAGTPLLVLFAVLFALYVFDPLTTKDVPVWQRMLLPLHVVGIGFVATQSLGAWPRRAVALVVALVVLGSGLLRLRSYDRIQLHLDRYVAAGQALEPGVVLLPLHLWDRFQEVDGALLGWRVDPFLHVSARIAIARQGVDLRSSLLAPSKFGYFPLVYREGRDPYVHIDAHLEYDSRDADLGALIAADIVPDAVLLFDPRVAAPEPPAGYALAASLAAAAYAPLPAGATPDGVRLWHRN